MVFFVLMGITIFCFSVLYFMQKHDQNKKGYELSVLVTHISGIENLNQGVDVEVNYYTDKLEINGYFLPFSRIKRTEFRTGKHVTEQQKSIIARTLAGGVLMGGLGMILGGISSVGTKKVDKDVFLLGITYIDRNGNDKYALFATERNMMSFGLQQISKKINEDINYVPESNQAFEI